MNEKSLLHAHQYSNHHVFESVSACLQWGDDLFLVLVSIYIRYCIISIYLSLSLFRLCFTHTHTQSRNVRVCLRLDGPFCTGLTVRMRKHWTFSDLKISWIDRSIILRSRAWPKHVWNYYNCFNMAIAVAGAEAIRRSNDRFAYENYFERKIAINCKQHRSNFDSWS